MDFTTIETFAGQFFVSPESAKIGLSVLVALLGYLIFSRLSNYWLRNVLQRVVEKGNFRKSRERQIKSWSLFVDRTGGIVILFILVTTVLSDLGYNIAPLLTGAGLIGIAIGLGSQNLLKDVVSGVFILLEGNYSVGDRVRIAGVSGRVKKINLRKTILKSDEDQSRHIIPNSEVKTVSILPKEPTSEELKELKKKGK